ncbi:MAG: tRNA (adenosine(37)-N6)-dimethylallyltransferase MiaA [Bdellovibrio sp. CG10_big_fil_rev_8_21_14_0_10_47_8]|nr:MAG: tRNA (adenosine(37)-N6)-dimethylallyltransferase MiaA [Bdellovibrio sp. CG10_big_fil_rev_8_21_14_0_10_47_8]
MKVVFFVGPTASGKSGIAHAWAKKYSGAIINCDSIQVYRSLDIGSAKPSPQEMKEVPHFLFDYVSVGDEMTAGRFQRDFFEILEKIKGQYPFVLVVGGTGFYFQAIEKGMFPVGASNPEIKADVEKELATAVGPGRLYRELQEKDPAAAEKISINDHYRLGRAVEMMRSHGKTRAQVEQEFREQQTPFPYPLLKLGLAVERDCLLSRVEVRVTEMLKRGLLQEVKVLIDQGHGEWAPLSSVGYRECVRFLRGEIPTELDLWKEIVQSTMKLVKKQRTWFQRDSELFWFSREQVDLAEAKLSAFRAN